VATKADVRTRVRTRIEDTGLTKLWTDAELDEGLHEVRDEYSQQYPDELTTTFEAVDGDTTTVASSGALGIVRVLAPEGRVIPPRAGHPMGYTADEATAWELFGGFLRFTRGLTAGTYTVWYRAARSFPAGASQRWTGIPSLRPRVTSA
jgi:hypothetical protein